MSQFVGAIAGETNSHVICLTTRKKIVTTLPLSLRLRTTLAAMKTLLHKAISVFRKIALCKSYTVPSPEGLSGAGVTAVLVSVTVGIPLRRWVVGPKSCTYASLRGRRTKGWEGES